jgi:hypothetical protein
MLSVNRINIQLGCTRVVLMMTPIFSPDNVSYGLGETRRDWNGCSTVEEDKTARGVHFKTYSEKMPSSSVHSDASTVYLEIHSSDQTVLCTAGLLFPVIGGVSAMFQYWCRWLSFRLPGRPLVLPVLNHHTTSTHRSESRFEVPNSAVIFIVAVYCYHAPPCSGLLTRRTSIISCKMVYHNISYLEVSIRKRQTPMVA